jgi:hypothetical protein
MAMLHWFYTTFNDNTTNRKQFFKLKVLYVDNSCIYYSGENLIKEREFKKNQIAKICEAYGFPYDVINLEHIYNEGSSNNFGSTDVVLITKLMKLYDSIARIGSFDRDFLKIGTRNLIFKYAIKNEFNKVVYGNNGHALVTNTFLNIIKGRGFTMKEEIEYVDSHYLDGKVKILRPMKDFLNKEVLLFNHINKVQQIYDTNTDGQDLASTKHTSKLNIPFKGDTYQLVNNFIDNLQSKMGSTITTVLGTTEKVKVRENTGQHTCTFCLNYIDEIYNNLEIGSIDVMNNEYI